MILYCIVCYLFALGILMAEREGGNILEMTIGEWFFFFLAPISVPAYAGYCFENN